LFFGGREMLKGNRNRGPGDGGGRGSGGRPGRLPRLSDGPLSRVVPQWHRGPATGGASTPADHAARADHTLDTASGAPPARRPHPGTGSPGHLPRDRDTA
ncbi:hypothetical protein P1P75_38000, partial [Streptomyces sp. ID05-39B]|nr:hypothetical protein [Streptomyces sp. ID05-39B]